MHIGERIIYPQRHGGVEETSRKYIPNLGSQYLSVSFNVSMLVLDPGMISSL